MIGHRLEQGGVNRAIQVEGMIGLSIESQKLANWFCLYGKCPTLVKHVTFIHNKINICLLLFLDRWYKSHTSVDSIKMSANHRCGVSASSYGTFHLRRFFLKRLLQCNNSIVWVFVCVETWDLVELFLRSNTGAVMSIRLLIVEKKAPM